MNLKELDIFTVVTYPKGVTMTDCIIEHADTGGFNTIYDDDDEVVMRDNNLILCLTMNADDTVTGTYYLR